MSDGRQEILAKFKGLRVTDVCDGMDALGMQDLGQMSRDIRPLWRDTENFTHRIYGIAHTVRFVPTDKPVPKYSPEEFYQWMSEWYRNLAGGPFVQDIKAGDVIVIDGMSAEPWGSLDPTMPSAGSPAARWVLSPTVAAEIRTS